MGDEDQGDDWERIIREMIAEATETAPTEPGVYKMPCGECVVDFFLNAEGQERWLVAGDARSSGSEPPQNSCGFSDPMSIRNPGRCTARRERSVLTIRSTEPPSSRAASGARSRA